jgi:catechol 2,3-dioxygenase-like lactoylglutathione lyase family enzyme
MKIHHVNHLGINVTDLAAATKFFTDLGFKVEGHATMQNELLDKVTGLTDAHTELVMLVAPDGEFNLEIVTYHQPTSPEESHAPAVNRLGLSHIAFEVDDLDGIVSAIEKKGYELVGEVQTFEKSWKLCYIRGPEGIIVELAERIGE